MITSGARATAASRLKRGYASPSFAVIDTPPATSISSVSIDSRPGTISGSGQST